MARSTHDDELALVPLMLITGLTALVFAADLIPGVPWVHLPVTMGYDRAPEKLIDEKASREEEWKAGDIDVVAEQLGEPYEFSEEEKKACFEKLWSPSLFQKTWDHYRSKVAG